MSTDIQSAWVQDLDPPRYVIVSARVTPMVELARWLFERHHIPYEEEGHAPLLHIPFTVRRKGRVEVPVIVSAASTWKGARETLHGLDSRLRSGERLFGVGTDERQSNIAFVDQLLERLLLNVRRLACFHLLTVKRLVFPVATDGVPAWERAIVFIFFPIWRRLMGRALDFSPAAIDAAPGKIAEAFDLVEAALEQRGARFLGGDAPNAMDIMFSALVAPLTLPTGYDSKLPNLEELPSELRRFVDSLRARRGGQLVLDTYAAARPAPQPPLKRPRRDQTLAQRLFGPRVQRLAARTAVAFSKPFVFKKFALVSRWPDVQSVLELDIPFRIQPINGPNFDAISGPFVLGLDRGPQFARERRQMYESVARIDSNDLRTRISDEADRILDVAVATSGRIDVAHGYAHPVAWMTDEIARRRLDAVAIDDVLGRLLAIRGDCGAPLDPEIARRILVGLLVGAIDTTAPTVPRIVCVLASDPALLAQVERDVDDRQRMLGWCSEALRMWSSAPVVFRRSSRATTIGGRVIGEGFKVAAFTQAAMFDPSVFPRPRRLDPTRPRSHYINFGGGLHPCAGRGVNDVQLPELVSRLVARGITCVGRPRFVGPFIDELVVTLRRPS